MYQQLTIIGRLGADPELRYTPTGTAVCSFNVATDRTWNNDQGVKQVETTWHRVTVWRKHAEVCAQYLSKGKMVLVTGSVKASGFTNRDGQISASLEVTADQVKFLSGSGAGAAEGAGGAADPGGKIVDEEAIPF
jgi:single-strand DNA-binding protein